jgi:tripartite-type tricarboxylate transporter receptor subunit TctC
VAIAAAKRSPLAPEVPTMTEAGVADFLASSYIGILAPAATPADVIVKLQVALAAALGAPKTLERMRELGVEVATAELMTSAGFGVFIRQDYDRSREAARVAGLKPE